MNRPPEALIVSGPWKQSDLLLISTLDGHLHAMDRLTGRIQWSCTELGGPLFKADPLTPSTAEEEMDLFALSRETNYFIEPVFPGGLYIYVPGDILQVQYPFRWLNFIS